MLGAGVILGRLVDAALARTLAALSALLDPHATPPHLMSNEEIDRMRDERGRSAERHT